MKYEIRFINNYGRVFMQETFETDEDPHSYANCKWRELVAMYDYEIDELEVEQ